MNIRYVSPCEDCDSENDNIDVHIRRRAHSTTCTFVGTMGGRFSLLVAEDGGRWLEVYETLPTSATDE